MVVELFKSVKKYLPLIGIAIFVYLIFSLDINKIKDAILSINPIFLVFAIIPMLPRVIIRNHVWQLILKEQKIHISYVESLKIYLIGYFYGSITPGYMGQLIRIPFMKEKTGEPYGKLFVNTLIETIIHSLSLYGMMIMGALLVVWAMPQIFTITIIWIIILGIVLFYFIKKERGEKLFYILIKYFIPKNLKKNLNIFVDTFYTDFPRIKKLVIPLIIGISTWVIIFSQEYIIVLGMGLDIPYLYFLLLFPIANVAGFIPITFAGLGTREFTSIFIFSTIFGVTKEEVFVFTLVGFIITDILTGFIGFILSLTEARTKYSI